MNSTVQYKAYFKQGSGLYGAKLTTDVDGIDDALIVEFRTVSFEVPSSINQDQVTGAQVYVDHVGHIDNQ